MQNGWIFYFLFVSVIVLLFLFCTVYVIKVIFQACMKSRRKDNGR